MKVIFCEECGGKNKVEPEMLANVSKQPIICLICGNIMSEETIVSHKRLTNTVDTLQYHLLFIDDDLFHLQLMKTSMEKEYRVSIASTGKQGLELAEELLPDLILLDINMPGIDGYEICQRLKKKQKTKKIPVIFVSARPEEDDDSRGFDVGAVDYISKPIKLQILNGRIAVQLRLKLLMEQLGEETDKLRCSLMENSLNIESEKKRSLQERNSFITILNNLQERVTVEDMNRRVVWANTAALEACNIRLADGIGKYCHEILQNSSRVCKECPLAAGNGNELNVPVEMNSSYLNARVLQSHLPLFDNDGELRGIAHIVTEKADISLDVDAGSSYSTENRAELVNSLSTILFGVDTISTMCREDKDLREISQFVGDAAERLEHMIKKILWS